jgi:Zn-dependent peptidase ImmA (M78 family)/transcriptional regulator with XRE-family HTH domain
MNRLRAYRDIENASQDELAKLLRIASATVSAIESGRRLPTEAFEQTGYSLSNFALPDMSEPLHRQLASTKVAARKRAKELLRLSGQIFAELRKTSPQIPDTSVRRFPDAVGIDDIEQTSVEARALLGLELSGPIANLTQAVERAGICLIPLVGLEGIVGMSSWVSGVPVIGVNPNIPGDRFRFTLAHEIGHLMLHFRFHDFAELEANRFAGALLMPEDDCKVSVTRDIQPRELIYLKASWGMALTAIVMRAHDVGQIDDARQRSLFIQLSRWRKNEPGQFSPAQGQLLPKLVSVNGGPEEVGRLLGLNKKHVATVVDWRRLRVA